jgi:hypothetical protein
MCTVSDCLKKRWYKLKSIKLHPIPLTHTHGLPMSIIRCPISFIEISLLGLSMSMRQISDPQQKARVPSFYVSPRQIQHQRLIQLVSLLRLTLGARLSTLSLSTVTMSCLVNITQGSMQGPMSMVPMTCYGVQLQTMGIFRCYWRQLECGNNQSRWSLANKPS